MDAGPCGSGDPNLPPEPTIPPACTVLQATQAVTGTANPAEDTLDTAAVQAALSACPAGQAVELTTNGANNAFVTGPLLLPNGVTLWIDAGTTLFASRNPALYGAACGTTTGACTPVLSAGSQNTGIVGDGVIDGQGGEPMLGSTMSWWDLTTASNGDSGNPPLIQAKSSQNFTLYRITLHNAPKFHVKLGAIGFVVWGVTVLTPSKTANAVGTALSAAKAPNTDGIDPGESAANGYIVCSKISDGDDQIAIKGGTNVTNVTIAHNHFGAGHGMSIGSETNGGVSNVNVYDLSIDGTNSGMKGGASNGIRIKSDPTQGGLVTGITYSDVCVRNVSNPIILNPTYSATTGPLPPTFTDITIRNFHEQTSTLATTLTVKGFDATHLTGLTLDDVIFDDTPAISGDQRERHPWTGQRQLHAHRRRRYRRRIRSPTPSSRPTAAPVSGSPSDLGRRARDAPRRRRGLRSRRHALGHDRGVRGRVEPRPSFGIGIASRQIVADDVRKVAGKPHEACIRESFPGLAERDLRRLIDETPGEDIRMVAELGGALFPGVVLGLARLARRRPLFIVSNCQSGYIETFLCD